MAIRAILVLFLSFASLSAFADVGDIVEVDGLNYKILTMPDGDAHGTVEVGDNRNYEGPTVTIPADITVSGSGNDGTYDVVGIGNEAFSNNTKVTDLDLSGATYLTVIGDFAFTACRGFNESLTIGNAVTTIGEMAFSGCTGFKVSVSAKPYCGYCCPCITLYRKKKE
jgi:hypothetical protein